MNRLLAILLQRCPVCLEGRTFTGLLTMNKHCPKCGVLYEREHGYFLNSMFVGYCVGFLVLVPSAVYMALKEYSVAFFAVAIIIETVLIWPLIFRYSRIIWMHLDQILDPRVRENE